MDQKLYNKVKFFLITLGVIPNSVKTMAHRTRIADCFTELNMAVMKCDGECTLEFKRLLGYVTSQSQGCNYWRAHMILASERFGASVERLTDVHNFETSPNFTEGEKAAFRYGQAAAKVPCAVTEEHGMALRAYWSEGDIVEITGVIALFGYLNRWNDSMGTTLEDKPIAAGKERLMGTGWSIGKHVNRFGEI